ncbi:MAG: rRNA maturation RNase YbeY [Methylococcaceae bacterium]|nr:rRNA maturation RNase YbeY [Methylococcaceae bacterium]
MQLEVQRASTAPGLPSDQTLQRWAEAALESDTRGGLVIRLVDEAESSELNGLYRHKQGATNVLSFPFEAPPGIETAILGDLVICAPVVEREAAEQDKSPESHWAHMVVHGTLHLRGYDHLDEDDALNMESREIAILAGLGFPNPYEVE